MTEIIVDKQTIDSLLASGKYTKSAVKSSEKTGKTERVWDLTVLSEDGLIPHSLITNGILTHNSLDPAYMQNMLSLHSKSRVSDAFGVKDEKSGKWLAKPRIRVYNEDVAESFFDSVSSLLRKLPLIEYRNKKWWYVFENTKEGKAAAKGQHSKKLFSETGRCYVEMPPNAPKMQAIIIVDSYSAMLPERLDEDDAGSGMAAQARMFAEQLRKVKPKLRKRGVTVVGINQLRLRPGVTYGCYHAATKVRRADGSYKTIKDIVDNKIADPVLAYNTATNTFEPRKVTAWFNNGPAKKWLKIQYKVDPNKRGNRTSSIVVTPDHEMWNEGLSTLVPARTLKIGDTLTAPSEYSLSEHARQSIMGMMVGDGWFSVKDGGYFRCNYAHKWEHRWYVDFKYNLMPMGTKYGKKDGLVVHELPFIRDEKLAQFCYERKKNLTGRAKTLTKEFCMELGPIALATWYMDDGDKGWITPLIKMQSYTLEDCFLMCETLNEKYGTHCIVEQWNDKSSKTGRGHGIKFDAAMMRILAPFVHEKWCPIVTKNIIKNAMRGGKKRRSEAKRLVPAYVKRFGTFKGWVSSNLVVGVPVEIIDIEKISKSEYGRQVSIGDTHQFLLDANRYEIQVEGLGLFVADGVVAKNSPEYEGGGEALKFFSDARIRQNARALSAVPGKPRGEGQLMEEKSVLEEGNDRYRFIHMRTIKNKLGGMTPYAETWVRLWVSDPKESSYGFDPVYDVFHYLLVTGQCSGNLKKMSIDIDGLKIKSISMVDLKALILLKGEDLKKVCKRLKIKEPPRLRARCLAQIKDGRAVKYFAECKNKGRGDEGEEEEGGDDE